jgi:hypothetical protein
MVSKTRKRKTVVDVGKRKEEKDKRINEGGACKMKPNDAVTERPGRERKEERKEGERERESTVEERYEMVNGKNASVEEYCVGYS